MRQGSEKNDVSSECPDNGELYKGWIKSSGNSSIVLKLYFITWGKHIYIPSI
jgi:hypothetical protein